MFVSWDFDIVSRVVQGENPTVLYRIRHDFKISVKVALLFIDNLGCFTKSGELGRLHAEIYVVGILFIYAVEVQ